MRTALHCIAISAKFSHVRGVLGCGRNAISASYSWLVALYSQCQSPSHHSTGGSGSLKQEACIGQNTWQRSCRQDGFALSTEVEVRGWQGVNLATPTIKLSPRISKPLATTPVSSHVYCVFACPPHFTHMASVLTRRRNTISRERERPTLYDIYHMRNSWTDQCFSRTSRFPTEVHMAILARTV